MQNNRRTFLKGSAAALTGAICATKAPYVFAKKTVTLRVMGTHVTLQEPLRRRAMQELGIDIRFEPMGSAAVLPQTSKNPYPGYLFMYIKNLIIKNPRSHIYIYIYI